MDYRIKTYSGDTFPSKDVGENIGNLLKDNYPESYSQKSKTNTLSKRNTSEKINDRIKNGYIYITLENTKKQVLGFLEMRKIRVEGGIYIQLCWLVINKIFQGKGFARVLYDDFETKAGEIGKTIKGNWYLQLMTGKNNPAQDIYRKWGYKEYKRNDTDIFMRKDV